MIFKNMLIIFIIILFSGCKFEETVKNIDNNYRKNSLKKTAEEFETYKYYNGIGVIISKNLVGKIYVQIEDTKEIYVCEDQNFYKICKNHINDTIFVNCSYVKRGINHQIKSKIVNIYDIYFLTNHYNDVEQQNVQYRGNGFIDILMYERFSGTKLF